MIQSSLRSTLWRTIMKPGRLIKSIDMVQAVYKGYAPRGTVVLYFIPPKHCQTWEDSPNMAKWNGSR